MVSPAERLRQLEEICRVAARYLRTKLVRVAFVVVVFDEQDGEAVIAHATNAARGRVARALRTLLQRIEKEGDPTMKD